MDELLTPALLSAVFGAVVYYGRDMRQKINGISDVVSTLAQCHVTRHPEDVTRFRLGAPPPGGL